MRKRPKMIYGVIVILTVLVFGFLQSENLFQDKYYKYTILAVYLLLAGIIVSSFSDDINTIVYLTTGTLLFISVMTDLQAKTIPIAYYLAIIPMLIIKAIIIPESFFNKGLLLNLLTILIFLIIGYIFSASLGFGDILLVMTVTMLLGYAVTMVLILIGLVLTSVIGLTLIVMHKANRSTKLPFTPFILVGFLIYLFI